jgi:hypothetical protein
MKILDLKRNEEKMFVLVQFKINMISNYNLSGVRVTQSVVFVWCFVDSYLSFCLFFGVIILPNFIRFTISGYPFDIYKLFLCWFGK